MESSLLCVEWESGRVEMQLRGGQTGTGEWTAVVRTMDFILREDFGWLRAVVSYILHNKVKLKINKYFRIKTHTHKKTPLSTENGLGAWKQGGVVRLSVMLRKMAVAWSRVSAVKW